MKPLPKEARAQNFSGGARCDRCSNTGQIVYAYRPSPNQLGWPGYEEMAPCPFCEKGYRLEFGHGRDGQGRETTNPDGGPWGSGGFWKGRDVPPVPEPTLTEIAVEELPAHIRDALGSWERRAVRPPA